MSLQKNTPTGYQKTVDELILVVPRNIVVPEPGWHGIKDADIAHYLTLITMHKEFLPRCAMEEDPTYKQIIPYLVFQYQDRFFLMQRKPNASAKALQNKFSLGIGGHIRQEDMAGKSIIDWAQREFHEEVDYQGSLTITPLGIINDDTNFVGQVHIGFAFLVQGDSPDIRIKDEHKSGELLTLQECSLYYDQMETWSQFIMQSLGKNSTRIY